MFRLPLTRARVEREVDDELRFHIETRIEQLVAAGFSPADARRQAERQFGDLGAVRDSCVALDAERERRANRAGAFDQLRQDVVFASRTLRRNIGATAIIVGALAVGIGANTAIFTLIDAVLVRSLPVPHPEQLVVVGDPSYVNSSGAGTPRTELLSVPLYHDVRDASRVFTGLAATGTAGRIDARIESGGELEHPRGRFVSTNYFDVLGVGARIGRTLHAAADSSLSESPPVTLSYSYWIRRFHGDLAVVGQPIVLSGVKFTIVGVAQASFSGEVVEESADLWIPIDTRDRIRPHDPVLSSRNRIWLLLIGRLTPGATLAQAEAEVGPIVIRSILDHATPRDAKAFLERTPRAFIGSGARGFSEARDTFHAPLVTLMIGVALLMCIICANVATLLLARAVARGREMAVRLALGAHRARLIRQLLTESAVLAAVSASVGLFAAWLLSRWLVAFAADGSAMTIDTRMNARVLCFTLMVSILAVILFGLLPALHASRVDLASAFRASSGDTGGGALAGGGRRPLGGLLIVGQIAISTVLLVGASMLVRSLRNLELQDPGFARDQLVVADLDVSARGYVGARLASVAHTIAERLSTVPGVAAVTYSENGIFSGTDWHTGVEIPGFVPRTSDDTLVGTDAVGPGYAAGIGARILAGRDIAASDEGKPGRAALVNSSLASFYFPHESAIGKFVHFDDSIAVQIVGVIADVRAQSLTRRAGRRLYYPYAHTDTGRGQLGNPGGLRVEVRTAGDPAAIVQSLRRTIVDVDPTLPIDAIATVPALVNRSISGERLVSRLSAAFGALALALASVGLYGVVSYAVTRRMGEMGLRIALGARRADLVALVLLGALRLVGAGLAIGLPLSVALAEFLTGQLHGVSAADPMSVGVALAVLALSVVGAAIVPAVRASKTSPMIALREN